MSVESFLEINLSFMNKKWNTRIKSKYPEFQCPGQKFRKYLLHKLSDVTSYYFLSSHLHSDSPGTKWKL
jgi:hypothetical protein